MSSMIKIARLSEDLAFQASAAKLLAPFSPETSALHLKNVHALYAQLGAELSAATDKTEGEPS